MSQGPARRGCQTEEGSRERGTPSVAAQASCAPLVAVLWPWLPSAAGMQKWPQPYLSRLGLPGSPGLMPTCALEPVSSCACYLPVNLYSSERWQGTERLGESQQEAAPEDHLSRGLPHNSTQLMARASSLGLPLHTHPLHRG